MFIYSKIVLFLVIISIYNVCVILPSLQIRDSLEEQLNTEHNSPAERTTKTCISKLFLQQLKDDQ